jgi:hypothetical protein
VGSTDRRLARDPRPPGLSIAPEESTLRRQEVETGRSPAASPRFLRIIVTLDASHSEAVVSICEELFPVGSMRSHVPLRYVKNFSDRKIRHRLPQPRPGHIYGFVSSCLSTPSGLAPGTAGANLIATFGAIGAPVATQWMRARDRQARSFRREGLISRPHVPPACVTLGHASP